MVEYVYLGPTPAMEPCADAIKQPDQSKRECRVHKHMLQRLFPIPANIPAWFVVKGSQHEWGTYYEVAVKYDDTKEAAIDFAYGVEEQLPEYWDEQAIRELTPVPA